MVFAFYYFRCSSVYHFDFMYDEIGSVLKIKQLRQTKQELFEALEMFYRVFYLGGEFEED